MKSLRRLVDKTMERFLIALLGVLVLDVLWQVFTRLVIRAPSSFTDELAGFLFIWVGLLGAAYASGKGMHLAIDLVPRAMGPANARRMRMFSDLMVMCFAATIMVVGGGRLVFITLSLNQLSPTMQIPLGYVYAAIPLSGILLIFYAVADLVGRKAISQGQGVGA